MFKGTSILILSLFAFFSFLPQTTLAVTSVTGHKIIIDAGHGGSDNGSTACPDLPEKTANLQIASTLQSLLEADGTTVYMTRTDDSNLTNADRYNFANSTGGEVLVSVHLNGSANPATDGTRGPDGKIGKDRALTQ